jgi:hypothetical protein
VGQGHCIETAKKNTAVFKWAFSFNGASAIWNIFRRTHSVRTGSVKLEEKKMNWPSNFWPVICGNVDFAPKEEENVN